ncbi:CU044_2847 family protein [Streptomyces sp. NPDC006458]|uniref:CU044_2847 family protein n=1 Tax=Streptomyces sp. NPDC006458 TaxID=3154302 RepID=UPI0033B9F8CD
MRDGQRDEGSDRLVLLDVDGQKVYMAVRELDGGHGGEREISGRARRRLDEALEGLTSTARAVVTQLRQSEATRVRVQFGCEFALESGSVVAVVGKARTSSAFTVELEWEQPSTP